MTILKKNTVGAIYPVSEEVLKYALKNKKNVYVKNSFHETMPNLSKGDILFFYVGAPYKRIMAKGTIKSIEVLDYKTLRKKYEKKLMQSYSVLKGYCGTQFIEGSWKKHVYNIQGLQEISEKIELPFPITMTGRYLTKEDYKKIKIIKVCKND